MSQIEAVHGKEAEVWLEKQMRDALAEQFHVEAKAEKKYEDEISTIKYREAQVCTCFLCIHILFSGLSSLSELEVSHFQAAAKVEIDNEGHIRDFGVQVYESF